MDSPQSKIADEIEKTVAEIDLKIYELSHVKNALQTLLEDIQDIENRSEKIRRLIMLHAIRERRLRTEVTANV